MSATFPMKSVSYRPIGLGRTGIWAAFCFLAFPFLLIAVALLTAYNGPPPMGAVLLALVPLLVLAWNGYWFLVRFSYKVTFDGQELAWASPARRGVISIDDVTSIEPFAINAHRITGQPGQRSIMVLNQRGLADLAELISAQRPGLPVKLSPTLRVASALPGRSRLTVLD